jgi:hypothetical protein
MLPDCYAGKGDGAGSSMVLNVGEVRFDLITHFLRELRSSVSRCQYQALRSTSIRLVTPSSWEPNANACRLIGSAPVHWKALSPGAEV